MNHSLSERLNRLRQTEAQKVGFPGWSRPFPSELLPFLSHEINNYGDSAQDPVFGWHTKDLERQLLSFLATVFDCRPGYWGYVTSGGGEGIIHGLWQARQRLPQARLYASASAHPSVFRAASLLRLETVVVPADPSGEIDYRALRRVLSQSPVSSAIVLATIGTTLTEAVDDVPQIRRILAGAGVRDHYIHADGAFAALPLAVSFPSPADLTFAVHERGVDSLSISGHKFLGAPFPCGVVLARTAPIDEQQTPHPDTAGTLCGAGDLIGSSRNGHAALLLWFHLHQLGLEGLREQAHRARTSAELAVHQLRQIGYKAWRSHPLAMTVVFPTPPVSVLREWPMPTVDGLSHIVCTPGVSAQRVRRFVAAVAAATTAPAVNTSTTPRRVAACSPLPQ